MKKFKFVLAGAMLVGSMATVGVITGETPMSAASLTNKSVSNNQTINKIAATNDNATKVVSNSFYSDVKKNYWAYPVILWGTEKNIIKGYPDGTFKPNKSVAESEFLAMLIRAYKPNNFKELDKNNHWADSYYQHSMKMNFPTVGARDTSKRKYIIDREHVAEIIAGTQGVNYKGEDAVQYLLGMGLAKGKKPTVVSIDNFDGEGNLSRAEAIQFIKNVLENGVKDKDGNPIMKPRPDKPSDPNKLPPLPGGDKDKTPTKPKPTEPKPTEPKPKPTEPKPKPTENLGKVPANDLYNKTKAYAKELGYSIGEFEHTYGHFTDKVGQSPAVSFLDRPEFGSIAITVRDWNDPKSVSLFKRTLENYGVNADEVFAEFNKLTVNNNKKNDGKQYKTQGSTFIVEKRLSGNQVQGTLVIQYKELAL